MLRQIVLDTETTGLSPTTGDRVIEIGCVEIIDRKPTGKTFHTYLNPDRDVPYGAYRVHGISTEFLKDKPRFPEIVEDLKSFLKDSELIIHNAPFDIGFLQHEFELLNDPWREISNHCSVFCTLAFARNKHPGQKNNLDVLCKRYNVDNARRTKHGALLDAEILTDLYLVMTGGQADLALSPTAKVETSAQRASVSIQNIDLPVILATFEEREAHQKHIDKMKSSGQSLWHALLSKES